MKPYHTAGLSDTGMQRKLNEDYFVIDDDLGLLIVTDGMGGHDAGEVASKEAAQIIHQCLKASQQDYLRYSQDVIGENADNDNTWHSLPNPLLSLVEKAIQTANSTINKINKDNGFSDNYGMGTTVVGTWILEKLELAIIFYVGDSRFYLFRDGCIGQMSVDHSLHQLWLDNGRVGAEPPKNIILAGIGLTETVELGTRLMAIKPNDVFLLCSDGLSDLIDDDDIAESLKKVTDSTLNEVCAELIEKANQAGGRDNITVSLALLHS